MADVSELLAAYDALRDRVPESLPRGVTVERDGSLVRFFGLAGRGFVVYRDLGGLEGAELDELIARQVKVFAERDERFEWKLHGHDQPGDLSERLRAAGFVPEETETVVIAAVPTIAAEVHLPEGVSLREVTSRADLQRIAALEQAVWGDGTSRTGSSTCSRRSGRSIPMRSRSWWQRPVPTVVCAAWIRFERGTDFATLWGGATLPEWRRRGIYRATVAYRATLAARRGFRYLETDASDDSRPILERLGFTAVTTTTPYVWAPPAGRATEP